MEDLTGALKTGTTALGTALTDSANSFTAMEFFCCCSICVSSYFSNLCSKSYKFFISSNEVCFTINFYHSSSFLVS